MKRHQLILLIILTMGAIATLSIATHWLLRQNSIGIDFYNHYAAGRALFVNQMSPYHPEVTHTIQMAIYQRAAKPGEDQFAFVYPPYHLLLLFPFFFLTFDWAQALWLVINIVLIMTGVLIAIPHPPKWLLFSVLFLYPFSFGLIMGTIAVFLGVLILWLYRCLLGPTRPSQALQILLGALLAWATCKPQFIWLYAILFVIIGFKFKYWPFLISLLVSLVALVAISFWLVPGWVPQIAGNLLVYSQNNHSWPTITNFLLCLFSKKTALVLSGIIFLTILAFTTHLILFWWHKKLATLSLFAWVGLATYLIHPNSAPYEQITMILPVLIWAGQSVTRNSQRAFYWFGGLVFYWLVFVLGRPPGLVQTVHDWPVFYYLPWVLWMVLQSIRSTTVLTALKHTDQAL